MKNYGKMGHQAIIILGKIINQKKLLLKYEDMVQINKFFKSF